MADGPVYGQQALTWAWTLLDIAHVPAERIVVFVVGDTDTAARRHLDELGIETRAIEPFSAALPHCNKLRQLEEPRFREPGVTICCDTDLAFAANIDDLAGTHAIRAKVVDLPNPPIELWRPILEAAGLPADAPLTTTSLREHTTPVGNCNGGLYMLPAWAVTALGEAWPRWVRWLAARPTLLPAPFGVHTDQVAFALALIDGGYSFDALPLEANFPTHLPPAMLPDRSPRVLHYHGNVDASGFLLPVGHRSVDEAIGQVNQTIARRRRDGFSNRAFWDFRYRHAPELGSGLGSRGPSLLFKRDLLGSIVRPTDTVADIGCGDLEVSRGLSVAAYDGVDVSAEALSLARSKRPDWRFHHGPLGDLDLGAHDVVVCFDVLIHQPTLAAYRALVSQLAALATRRLVVSGYDQPPVLTSEITFFYEPLTASLERLAGTAALTPHGSYRDTSAVSVAIDTLEASTVAVRLRRARRFDTPLGRYRALEGDLIAHQFTEFGGHTRNELAMVRSFLRPGDVVVDAGAHIGSFAVPMAAAVGATGRVLAVEPDPVNVELLYMNIAANGVGGRVLVEERVLASTIDHYGGLPDPANTGALRFVAGRRDDGLVASRVDDVVGRHLGDARVRLIKIDVEGMERSVLESAEGTVARSRPLIYLEVADAQLARYGTTVSDLGTFLTDRRYALFRNQGARNSTHDRFDIAPLARLEDGGEFFDCLAVPTEEVGTLATQGLLPAPRGSGSG
jgi:FkbM family methyltransferase